MITMYIKVKLKLVLKV